MLEEIARADVSSAICCQLTFNGPPRGIEHLGPEAMKERWLPAAADGDALISIGITEPDAGSAVQNMRAALVEDGPGRWRLNALQELLDPGRRRPGRAGLVPLARRRGGQGHRRGDRADRPRRRVGHRAAQGHGDPRRHRGRAGLRRRGDHRRRRADRRGTPRTPTRSRCCSRTSTTSAAATRRCASAPRRGRWSTRCAT